MGNESGLSGMELLMVFILAVGGLVFLLILGRELIAWAFKTTDIADRLRAVENHTADIAALLREQSEREKKRATVEDQEPAIR